MYPSDYLYSKDHEWVRVENDVCVLGITDFAQKELGSVVYVDLPEVGQTFAAGDEIGSIESVKAVAEVYTPVGGEIVEVNGNLEESPDLINADPHGLGWIVKIRLDSREELAQLMNAAGYQAFLSAREE